MAALKIKASSQKGERVKGQEGERWQGAKGKGER